MSLENVRAGDTLIRFCGHPEVAEAVTVNRVTKTQIIIGHVKYRKLTGFPVGRPMYARSYIRLPREGEIKKLENEQRCRRLCRKIANACKQRKLLMLSYEALVHIDAVISSYIREEDE